MNKFSVKIPEVHYVTVEIEAKDEADAREKVSIMLAEADGGIDFDNLEYSHTLDVSQWPVTKLL